MPSSLGLLAWQAPAGPHGLALLHKPVPAGLLQSLLRDLSQAGARIKPGSVPG